MSHKASCLNYTITVIAENNDATRASDERDGTATDLTPETAEAAERWLDDGIAECMCDCESASWHRMWSS